MATLHYTLTVDGLDDNSLVVRGFEGQETLSDDLYLDNHGFRYEIALASRRPNLSPEQMVDMQAELKLYRNGELTQRV
ncbi:type VI secretion system tip protein VgrG, partial [Vibrio sp. C8]